MRITTDDYIRPEVMAFARAMEATLRKHDHKGGWGDCSIEYLFNGVHRELKEAEAEWNIRPLNCYRFSDEIIDVANFCMMCWHKAHLGIAVQKVK